MHYVKEMRYLRIFTENMNFLLELNRIEDDETLFKKLDKMSECKKEILEDSIIGLYNLNSEENNIFKTFLDRYKKYIIEKSNTDVMYYLNNRFLNLFYCEELTKKDTNKAYDGIILGRIFENIYDEIYNKYLELNEKIDKNEKLSEEEISFMKKLYINFALFESFSVDVDGSEENDYDIIDFCNQYPLNIEKSLEDQQIFLIYNIVKSLITIKGKYHIIFNQYHVGNDYNTLGSVSNYKGRADEFLITINYTNQILFENKDQIVDVLFTVFHEIGHILQRNCKDSYDSDMLDIFEKEHFVLKNDRAFYNKYHDSFTIEQDANLYAFNTMIDLFLDTYPEFCDYTMKRMKSKKLIDSELFTKLFFEKYEQLKSEQNNKSVTK